MLENIGGVTVSDPGKVKVGKPHTVKKNKTDDDKSTAKKPKEPVPVVEEKKEDENTGLDVVEITRDTEKSVKSIASFSNTADDIYDDIKGMRASLEDTNTADADEQLDEVEDASKFISDQEDNSINEKMMTLHQNYSTKYGDKYTHGSATTDNYYQHEFTTGTRSFTTNNNASVVIGRKTSTTLIDATFEYSRTNAPATPSASEEDSEDDSALLTGTKAVTRSDDEDYPDPEDPPQPPQPREISNDRSIDVSILHNRNVNISDKAYNIGLGAEYHNHDNGQNTQLTFRGGFVNPTSGIGLAVATTNYGSVDEDGNRHSLRDTKVRAIILNNEVDEYPAEEAQKAGVQDVSDLPIVKTKNKLGVHFITENKNLGGNLSYVVSDVSSLDNDTYKRSQLYFKGGYLNEPQGEDEPDKHRIKLGATWSYQRVKSNGNYLNAKLSATYHNTLQSGEQSDYLLGISGELETKFGNNHVSFQGSDVKTRNTKFLSLTAGYTYSNKKWDVGANIGYYKMDYFSAPLDYISAGVTAAYKF